MFTHRVYQPATMALPSWLKRYKRILLPYHRLLDWNGVLMATGAWFRYEVRQTRDGDRHNMCFPYFKGFNPPKVQEYVFSKQNRDEIEGWEVYIVRRRPRSNVYYLYIRRYIVEIHTEWVCIRLCNVYYIYHKNIESLSLFFLHAHLSIQYVNY